MRFYDTVQNVRRWAVFSLPFVVHSRYKLLYTIIMKSPNLRRYITVMEKALKGLALILFGLMLCIADPILNSGVFVTLSDLPFALLGLFTGIVGIVIVFYRKKK